ncbi:MAG: enoyl-CoA hydratase family protein [Nocardioidaceae bacterium]|jgi:enoyl-CoA hydratase/carnithine racemase|nr:enoyl-CoA hydratase family protein [Nocardioidaceae bacterium]
MSPFRGSASITDEWRHFTVQRDGRVATITFARPDRLNALTFEVYADLRDLLTELPHRDDTRVVVLRGEGRAFCSGGDVHQIIGATIGMRPEELLSFTRMTGEVVRVMRETPVPIIAAINGTAAGAGAVLALASDFRVMARSASFAFLFTKVGLAGADMGAAYLLPRLVGLGRATQLLMLGDSLPADKAEQWGLVSDLVEDGEVDATAIALARRLADGPWQAFSQTKSLLTRELDLGLSGAVELEAVTQALLMKGDDYREFHAAFTGKRSPQWKGR